MVVACSVRTRIQEAALTVKVQTSQHTSTRCAPSGCLLKPEARGNKAGDRVGQDGAIAVSRITRLPVRNVK